jgi:hypothetical protein
MTAHSSYVINTGHVALGLTLAVGLLCLPKLSHSSEIGQQRAAEAAPLRAAEKAQRDQLLNMERVGDLALKRVETGLCIPVINADSGQPNYFAESITKVTARTNGQPLPPGTVVCNSFRETGVLGSDGRIMSIAIAPLDKADEYAAAFEKL